MNQRQDTSPTQKTIRAALERSWSSDTSVCYNPAIAPTSYGQCAQTAVVVYELLGGEILRTEVGKVGGGLVRHFYNKVAGERLDFTADQFNIPGYWHEFAYQDLSSSVEEARTELLPGQIEAMRAAFRQAIGGSNVA